MLTLRTYRPLIAPEVLDRVYDAHRAQAAAHILPVDVRAEGDDFIVTAAVPGLRAEDVQVEVLAERVTLHGEIPTPTADEAGKATWLLQERRYGAFTRTLDFPVELNGAQAEAVVENGLLTLRLPKAETAKPKVVKVNAK